MTPTPVTPFEKRQFEKKQLAERRRRRTRRRLTITLIVSLCGVLLVSAAVLLLKTVDWEVVFGNKDPRIGMITDATEPFGPDPAVYFDPWSSKTEYLTVSGSAVHTGECVLVNADHAFRFDTADEPVRVFDHKSKTYSTRDNRIYLTLPTIEAFNGFMDAFYDEKDHADIMISSAYRSYEDQVSVWDEYMETRGEEYTKQYVSVPGYSEHHSGLAMDLAIYTGVISSLKNFGDYSWIYENAPEYGFIHRYTKEKTDITGIAAESWHFRYVTVPHALLISQQGYCLEEYLEYIRIYTYKGTRAHVTSEKTGDSYEIYFVYAETEPDEEKPLTDADGNITGYEPLLDEYGDPCFKKTQQIPIPRGTDPDTVSVLGNNMDGFLVTIRTPGEKPAENDPAE